ncbi:hypothetical protein MAR_012005 [Mya arenaria]|uniref:Uncharacterized protein n=1 Tax=Mya arenaria TaxID=6604 RepID=A0ABY7FZW8_MYAAR|nr:hypothetical protein MAR_012005 [Mya arenaria]
MRTVSTRKRLSNALGVEMSMVYQKQLYNISGNVVTTQKELTKMSIFARGFLFLRSLTVLTAESTLVTNSDVANDYNNYRDDVESKKNNKWPYVDLKIYETVRYCCTPLNLNSAIVSQWKFYQSYLIVKDLYVAGKADVQRNVRSATAKHIRELQAVSCFPHSFLRCSSREERALERGVEASDPARVVGGRDVVKMNPAALSDLGMPAHAKIVVTAPNADVLPGSAKLLRIRKLGALSLNFFKHTDVYSSSGFRPGIGAASDFACPLSASTFSNTGETFINCFRASCALCVGLISFLAEGCFKSKSNKYTGELISIEVVVPVTAFVNLSLMKPAAKRATCCQPTIKMPVVGTAEL